jgi:hypothetical protein
VRVPADKNWAASSESSAKRVLPTYSVTTS